MLNKNKIIIFFILIFVFFSFSSEQKDILVLATSKISNVVPESLPKYWKTLDFAINFNVDLSADITETHDIVFNQRLDGQPFQSLVEIINVSNYGRLNPLDIKIYEKTKDGKLIPYVSEDSEQKVNGKFYIEGIDVTQKLFSIRIFFDAKNEEKTFIFKYKLTNPRYPFFINFFSDYDDILLYPIPSSSDVFIQDLTIHLTLPNKVTENDLYFWGLPKSSDYKTEIFSNKVSFTGIINKTDTSIGFELLVKAGIFTKPIDIPRKNSAILQNKINEYSGKTDSTANSNNITKSVSVITGFLITLIGAIYIIKVYLDLRLKRVSKKDKSFEDADVLKYKNFKPYFSGMLLHKKVNRNDLTSMLIDLCIRDYLSLRISRSKDANGKIVNLFILDKSEIEVKNDVLSNTEAVLLNYIFKRSNSVYLSSLEDSYRSRTSYFYPFIGKEILNYKLFAVPPFIHNLSLYKLLLKTLFILISISFLLLPTSYIYLFLVPLFFVFFTNVLIIESPLGTKIKRNLIAFQDFCSNWNKEIDETFVNRIPYFVSLACFSSVITVVSKEKTLQELKIDWLTLETEKSGLEEKTIAIEKKLEENVIATDIPTWNDLALFLDKIRKTFGK